MSIEALKWALDIGEEFDLEPPRRLVLIMLGNSSDPAGGHLFPSHGYLSRRTGLANSTVRAHLAALQKAKLLIREPRAREDGGQTSNQYRLAMRQPGLNLEDTPLPESSRGGVVAGTPPASQPAPPPSHTKGLKQELVDLRLAKASPVAGAFKVYQDGIKAKYGTTYPPSAKANGMLKQLVARVGAGEAENVIRHYLAHQNPFYARVKHKLDFLIRDAEQIYMDFQAASGTATAKAPTTARIALLAGDNRVMRELAEVPAGNMQQIALQAVRDHTTLVAHLSPKYVAVRQGAERRQYSLEELGEALAAHR